MKRQLLRYKTLTLLVMCIVSIFVVRTALAVTGHPPQLDSLFTVITLAGSLVVCVAGYRNIRSSDWIIAFSLGTLVGLGMSYATLFTPYPFFGIVRDNLGQAAVRGACVTLALLGGMVIMRWGGPVKILVANGDWRKSSSSICFG